MKFFIKPILISILLSTITFAQNIDINKKLKEAGLNDKQVMFFFHIPRCPYCETMLKENFKNKDILTVIEKNFVLVDIYTADKRTVLFKDFKGTTKEFASYIGASAYPATLFTSQEGKVVHKAIGYRNIKEFINELKYTATKSYEKIDLETFILNMEMSEDD